MIKPLTTLVIETHGLHIAVHSDQSDITLRLEHYLPPGWKPLDATTKVEKNYTILNESASSQWVLYDEGKEIYHSEEPILVYERLDSALRLWIGAHVRNVLFIHAGVVGLNGKAIVIPGKSMLGKTTLVYALIKQGAIYYSDEYAVIDRQGLVHSYARPLSIRHSSPTRFKLMPVEEMGVQIGKEALPLGWIIKTHFETGAVWSPQTMSSGDAMMTLFENAFIDRVHPEITFEILEKALASARFFAHARGDASETALEMLRFFRQSDVQ